MANTIKIGDFTIEDHTSRTQDGQENPLFVVKWGRNRQSYKDKEEAIKFCENAGKIDKSVRLEKGEGKKEKK